MIDIEAANAGDWFGYLTDWDLCKYKEDVEQSIPSLPGRSVSLLRISETKSHSDEAVALHQGYLAFHVVANAPRR